MTVNALILILFREALRLYLKYNFNIYRISRGCANFHFFRSNTCPEFKFLYQIFTFYFIFAKFGLFLRKQTMLIEIKDILKAILLTKTEVNFEENYSEL